MGIVLDWNQGDQVDVLAEVYKPIVHLRCIQVSKGVPKNFLHAQHLNETSLSEH